MMNEKFIGENIKALRDKMGFSQTSIARFLNVDQSLISKVEKGERTLSAENKSASVLLADSVTILCDSVSLVVSDSLSR